jgi:hypothetical protein
MSKLNDAIDEGCKNLRWIAEAVARTRPSGTLCEKSYNFFETSAPLADQLEDAKDLLLVRNVALSAARQFPRQISATNPDKFMYNGVEVTFRQGRFLGLQNYAATTWALYDAVAKVAGILCCVDQRSKDPASPVKLPEDLLQGQKCVGARIPDHLKGAYGLPIGLSYAIRNWLVHDGHAQNGVELFEFEGLTSTPYQVSSAAWDKIQDRVTNVYKVDSSQTRLRPFPDVQRNLLPGLVDCHEEVDEAIAFVLAWSIASVRSQAEILFPRDGAISAVAAAAAPVATAPTTPTGQTGTALP